MCKKDIILFISIFCVLALISGSTFAYWGWSSNTNKSVVFNTSHGIEDYFVYDEGTSHFVGDFQSSTNYCGGMSNTISFNKTSEVEHQNLTATINMDVNNIGSNIRNSDAVYWVITSGDSTSCTGNLSDALHYGTFHGVANGAIIPLETDVEVLASSKTFTIWIWINPLGSNLSSLPGETIDVNVWTQVDMRDNVVITDNCVQVVNDFTEETWWLQKDDGLVYLPSEYRYYYTYDEENSCAMDLFIGGESVEIECGTKLIVDVAGGSSMPPDC